MPIHAFRFNNSQQEDHYKPEIPSLEGENRGYESPPQSDDNEVPPSSIPQSPAFSLPRYSLSITLLYILALVTTALTFVLLCSGGLVTSKGVGMSVPDWPTTYGYNMFLFPLPRW